MTALVVVAGSVVAGAAFCYVTVRLAAGHLSKPSHLRLNYAGRSIPGTTGVVLIGSLAMGGAIGLWFDRSGLVVAGAAALMGVLGLLDDLHGGGPEGGGFAGHVRALTRGRVTTGLVKALGGGAVGLASAWILGWRGWWTVAAGAVVALSTNLVNLFDRRPGRAGKVWAIGWVLLLAAGLPLGALAVSAATAGGLAVLTPRELTERAMLGDAGANLLGAVLGVSAIVSLGASAVLWLLGVLVVLNLASEVVSFGRVIERVPLLRALDHFGRAR